MSSCRLIVTTECPRECAYCCNNHKHILDQINWINGIGDLPDFSHIVVTGGEPLLRTDHTNWVVNQIRRSQPDAKLFLQTSIFNPDLTDHYYLLQFFAGITFSLHREADDVDMKRFRRVQNYLADRDDYSRRLWVHKEINQDVPLFYGAWDRIHIELDQPDGECIFPENTLFGLMP